MNLTGFVNEKVLKIAKTCPNTQGKSKKGEKG